MVDGLTWQGWQKDNIGRMVNGWWFALVKRILDKGLPAGAVLHWFCNI